MRLGGFQIGQDGDYQWITFPHHRGTLGQLLRSVPGLVIGKVIAITALDSGPATPSEDERGLGWSRIGTILWTAPITNPCQLPIAGYDEWYIFETESDLTAVEVFVNYGGWTLQKLADPRDELKANPTWDRVAAEAGMRQDSDLKGRFWNQLKKHRPLSLVADGDWFNLVTRDPSLFEEVQKWVAGQV